MKERVNPSWRKAIAANQNWIWDGDKLWHRKAERSKPAERSNGWTRRFVEFVYADQNRSRVVKETLASVLAQRPKDAIALNLGAGLTAFPDVVNLEISDGPAVDIVGWGTCLPFEDNTVDLVIAQEVLEHVPDFLDLVDEILRVLKPGGLFFCQVPFQIGFHPGPCDYWRFSRQALEHMFAGPAWKSEKLEITLGHGSGFYRIAVEFCAVTASCMFESAYRPAKATAAAFLYPLKWFDRLTPYSAERDRIPGGYLCLVRKAEGPS